MSFEDECKVNSDRMFFADLLRELSKADVQWFSLGAYLNVPYYKLKLWKKQYDNNAECVQDLVIWLADNTHVTWEEVVKALCEIGRYEQARQTCVDHRECTM